LRRSGRSIAAIASGAVLALLGGAGLIAAWTQATADIVPDDPDEAIRTAPETLPDFSAVPIEEPQAEVAALRAPTPPVAVEYAQLSAATLDRVASPAFRQAGSAIRDYEPRIQIGGVERDAGGRYSEVSFGLNRPARVRRPAQTNGSNSLASVRDRLAPAREVERRGRWVLFASDDQQAVGLNLLRARSGEMARMSLTTDGVASVGDMQAGFGWRRGAFQASLAFVDREISIYGKSRDEQFLAFTISIRPRDAASGERRDRMQPAPYSPRANPN
jgi:hypothetical protein